MDKKRLDIIRPIILAVIPLFAGWMFELALNKDESFIYWLFFSIAIIIYIGILVYFAFKDYKTNIDIENLKLVSISNVNDMISDVNSFLIKYSNKLYSVVKKANNEQHTEVQDWVTVESYFDDVCKALYDFLKEICETGNNLSVSIVCKVMQNGTNGFYMASQYGHNLNRPGMYRNFVDEEDAKDKLYCKIINSNNIDFQVCASKRDVKKKFDKSPTDKNYSQYIGIPIYCSGKKIIALLQIVAYDNTKISSDKRKLREIANQYCVFFSNLGLLINKIENIIQYVDLSKTEDSSD